MTKWWKSPRKAFALARQFSTIPLAKLLPNEALPNEFVRLSFLISYIATGERLLIGSLALVNKVNQFLHSHN